MPVGFPCPNPTCTHVFAPEAIKGATSLRCPRCGTVFNFRSEAPAPPPAPSKAVPVARPVATSPAARPATPPQAKAVPPARPAAPAPPAPLAIARAVPPAATPSPPPGLPIAAPVAPTVPAVAVAMPVAPAEPAAEAAPNPALVFSSKPGVTIALSRRRPYPWRLPIALLIAAVVAGGIVVGVVLLIQQLPPASGSKNANKGEDDSGQQYTGGNFRFKAPDAPWKKDEALSASLNVPLAYSRRGPVSCVALAVKDYEKRFPGKGVLIDETLGHLRTYFPDDLAWAPKLPATPEKLGKYAKLGGQPALAIEFEGNHNEVEYSGECLIVEYRGRVYWFYTFAPQSMPEAREEWRDLRSGFALLNEREGWKEQERPQQRIRRNGYALAYPTGVWKQKQNTELYDARADLVLEGHDPKAEPEGDASKAGKAALCRVILLPKQKDLVAATAAARDHILGRYATAFGIDKKDVQLTVDLDKKGEKKEGDGPVGKANGHVSKNRLQPAGGTAERFVLMAVVHQDEQNVVIDADCDWKRRDFWEQEFNAILEKFEPTGK
jgi:hypothetical protein